MSEMGPRDRYELMVGWQDLGIPHFGMYGYPQILIKTSLGADESKVDSRLR